ncbi:catechol 2,3-dioxygenase-like lactoylglutathione lyase family enzyme [Arthrobacter sp. CAN_A6]|uniref:VOC family protein n=1 Tax=Arthrobacter sp. CAN_A6 TaxID=2787721 RepID=UPI0018CA8427
MIGFVSSTVFDCADADRLATFYEAVLGMTRVEDNPDWITIRTPPDGPALAFQRVEDYTPPRWPGQVVPQQVHLDIRVDSLDVAEKKVLALGAVSLDAGTDTFRVYLDPAGHPFCLVLD